MTEFFQTPMGRHFFERDIPRIADALERIADALEKQRIADALERIADALEKQRINLPKPSRNGESKGNDTGE